MNTSIVPANALKRENVYDGDGTGIGDKIAKKAFFRLVSGIKRGRITVKEKDRVYDFGRERGDFPVHAKIQVHDPKFYRKTLFGGSIGAGETYMAGYWSADSLTDVVRLVIANQSVMKNIDRGWSRISALFNAIFHVLNRNTRKGSRANIQAHYDLGNEFYELFLDPTMTYSSGIFESESSTMEEASLAKYERLCRKLELTEKDHVLEIGSGWGGFAIYAASKYGCRVTSTTISEKQFELASKRVRKAGLQDLVQIIKEDYRELEGIYDKMVSIEMIEAVGHRYYETFFKKCSELLKPEGMFAMQAITISDYAFDEYKNSVDFINRYIFPGGCIPSITALNLASARVTDMKLFNLEDITPHYARTLRNWRDKFFENIDEVKALGFPESFVRMWDFYLSYCEAGFTERYIGVVQMVFTKPLSRRAPILNYSLDGREE